MANGSIPSAASCACARRVLQIWYASSPEAEARIQAIREAFKAQFHQLSVMRVDGRDCVSF